MRGAVGAGLGARSLAEEIIFFDRGQPGVRVGAADQSELVRIDAKLCFELEPVLERRTRIFEFEHLGLLRFAEIEIALVPALEVGELIVRRKKRMRLAVAFDLRHFVERLPAGASVGVGAVDLVAGERLDDREHAAVAEIAVVRQGEHFAAGFFFGGSHPFPQVARIVAAERRIDRERLDQARALAVLTKDDVAMQVVAAGVRRPLEADEGRKSARLVGVVRGFDGFAPGAAIGGGAGQRHDFFREGALGKRHDDFDGCVRSLARLDHVVPPAARRVGEHFRLAREQVRKKSHVVGMIGRRP